jgi:hypothetical protein
MMYTNGQPIMTRNRVEGKYLCVDPDSGGRKHWVLLGQHTNPTLINDENLFSDETFYERFLANVPNDALIAEIRRRSL